GFGFITLRTGLGANDQRHDIFCHITDVTRPDGVAVDNNYLAGLKHRETVLEFDLVETEEGLKAVNVQEYRWWR
ncbi:MAG: cold-shock protein, partial [Desulfococcaceae bacterium]